MDCGHAGLLRDTWHLGQRRNWQSASERVWVLRRGSSAEHRWVLPSALGACLEGRQESLELGAPNGRVQVTCFLLLHVLGARFAGFV